MYNSDFFDFIEENKDKDPMELRLKLRQNNYNFDIQSAITQIDARKRYSRKLKYFLGFKKFIFPDALSGEQASHQAVGKYHASLLSPGLSLIDLTAGLGIDAMSFASAGINVTAIDIDPVKTECLRHNSNVLKINFEKILNEDSVSFLEKTDLKYDIIFIDPARRDGSLNRVYNFKDCSPNILDHKDLLFSHASRILIKTSPLLDVDQTLKDLPFTKSITALGIKGECKELLIELEKGHPSSDTVIRKAVNLDNNGNILYEFKANLPNELEHKNLNYASLESLQSGKFILEPSAMVMKLSPWKEICDRFNAKKFAPSSNLFITEKEPKNFPGKVSIFSQLIKKGDRKSLLGFPATAISRNHPLSSDELRKKFSLSEGEESIIYATRIGNKPVIFLSQKR